MGIASLLLFFRSLFSEENGNAYSSPELYSQWFVGPILAPNPQALPVGHPALELAFLGYENYGMYNNNGHVHKTKSIWSIGPYIDFQISLNEIIGVEYIGAFLTNFSQGAQYAHFQDSIFRFGIQILNDKLESWVPDFRILFEEIFPTGNYEKFNPDRYGTDSTGKGSFQSGLYFAFQKLVSLPNGHNLRSRLDLGYFFPSPVQVKGINFYGGDSYTKGKVYPGHYFSGYICVEYSLTRTLAFTVESNYLWGRKGHYSQKSGPHIEIPSDWQISLAPEIQYTFTTNFGILLGSWFTVAGQNTSAFRSYFVSGLYVF